MGFDRITKVSQYTRQFANERADGASPMVPLSLDSWRHRGVIGRRWGEPGVAQAPSQYCQQQAAVTLEGKEMDAGLIAVGLELS